MGDRMSRLRGQLNKVCCPSIGAKQKGNCKATLRGTCTGRRRVYGEGTPTSVKSLGASPDPGLPEHVRDDQTVVHSLLRALKVQDIREAKDLAAALLMSEAVYKVADGSLQQAVADISKAAAELPAALQQPLRLQWSLPHVPHRFLLAEGDTSIYVAFMGTKRREDFVTNSAVYQELLWKEQRFRLQGEPAAHTGFVRRARSIPVKKLLESAEFKGKKLILCGHSLGGGVAELCALDLLHAAKPGSLPNIHAIGFASPAIGNQALSFFVQQRGWKKFLTTYLLPEDTLGRWLAFLPQAEELQESIGPTTSQPSQTPEDKHSTWEHREAPAAHASSSVVLGTPDVGGRAANSTQIRNNIVSFPFSQVPKLSGEAALSKAALVVATRQEEDEKYAPVAWAARFAYRAVTFPFWVHRSFVPVSQRVYLNLEGVDGSRGGSNPDIPAFARVAAREGAKSSAAGNAHRYSSGQSQLLSMHRLPAYRSRLKQISQDALQPATKVNSSQPPSVQLSTSIADHVSLQKATLVRPGASLYSHLEDCMGSAGFQGTWPQHCQKLFTDAKTSSRIRRMWGVLKGWWQRHVGGRVISHSLPDCLLLTVQGSGLEHCTHFHLVLPGGQHFRAEVVYVPRMPMNYGQQMEGPNALATLLGWLGMLQAALVPVTAKVVLLRIDLSQAEADKVRAYLSDGLERPQLTCLSAFYSGSIDVSPCPRSARRLSRLVTSSAYFPVQSHLSQLCQKS